MAKEYYKLPPLAYGYDELEPYISEEQLRLHHDKHHQSYVDNLNSIIKMVEKAREEGKDYDYKAATKAASFNAGGNVLHDYFWWEMMPAEKAGEEPVGELLEQIKKDFGSFERFKKEFSQVALTVEGSGWAALTYCGDTHRLSPIQIEKHNVNVYPDYPIIMVLDMWEHAYYIDYRNEKAKFVDGFWNIINWEELDKHFKKYL
ncbi:Superoxide dismutase [Methanosalsum zhilinae DSM 4017]|uniref:Superoxide dismutase n=1 Tax=Methanosalsum zhilinae (strain DSM 4017 / NBRC 107636 / OCM 62 / WeN5) TaxID=679901 RepID=F7XLC9_METZD|nr:superoxide dismutase [Methanosalsum zhilinae]AEH60788.1 Superoxide dismutase [Methanosalsum zhilinae DSM 4017]